MGHEADFTESGIHPVRDHRKVPVSLRHYPAATAIAGVHEDGALELPVVNGAHAAGDWQAWRFWPATGTGQPAPSAPVTTPGDVPIRTIKAAEAAAPGPAGGTGATARGFGSWSPIFPAVVSRRIGVESPEEGWHPLVTTGGVERKVSLDPIKDESYKGDERYDPRPWKVPGGLATPPAGMLFVATAGMVEGRQAEVHLQADGRIICPGQNGLGHMATLVCDLEPKGVIAVGNDASNVEPGFDTRSSRIARISTAFRVVRLDKVNGVPAHSGNAVALQFASTDQEGMLGYGCVYGLVDTGGPSPARNPVTTPGASVMGPGVPGYRPLPGAPGGTTPPPVFQAPPSFWYGF